MGSLSGFDRLVFRGTLRRLLYPQGMDYCLAFLGVLLKDFALYVLQVTARLKEASLAAARRADRPIQYLASSQTSKEDLARKIAARDHLAEGLICVLIPSCNQKEIYGSRRLKPAAAQARRLCHLLIATRYQPSEATARRHQDQALGGQQSYQALRQRGIQPSGGDHHQPNRGLQGPAA